MKKALILLVCSLAFLGGAVLWPETSTKSAPCEEDECNVEWDFWGRRIERCIPNTGEKTYCDMANYNDCVTKSCFEPE